ncbi:diaminopimelate decarboxylase [Streptomonospora nanhaiensis]|uniref:Diaminopimelate decarboxylase n=1 Tax=Streptomonospora nanhaiensis TaxID=1323731 RepID=A0A853BMG2_9ACTN|nr:diaminopimelate decarboxylase [Streptomonospora nanhaiensis]MBV2365325.1 diaminopimelate decarboxylase [Streptomonospora nanhaiensis]MBX9390622.1 diaminopimelate decarboxylase [Streptomonospora nanhaiensis]NYI95895.1 diaminopimelate decarboxylase [Streptomonospora nanhaiensis]
MSRYAHPAGPRHADVLPEDNPPRPPRDLGELATHVWPRTARRGADGELVIGGVGARDLARRHGTPLFVMDEQDFRARARAYRTAFSDAEADVYYAGKALLTKAVARWVHEEGLKLDVCSGGELAVALAAGFPPERIGMHGNNKSEAELTRAVEVGVGRIIVDSFDEIERLERIAAGLGRVPKVLVRVTTGVEAHTHEFVATAHDDQKFGFALSTGAADEAVRRVLAAPHIELVGLHSHIGSQIFDTAGFDVAARRVTEFMVRVIAETGADLPELDLGGGLGIAYVPDDTPLEPEAIAKSLLGIVRHECESHGLPMPRIAVEPGRALTGPAGVTLYEVGTVKDVEGIRTYVSVDGGMSDNIRTALYGAEYTCALASRTGAGAPLLSRLVGKHCESGDIIVHDLYLPADIRPGDLVAVAATGAYCFSMASNYNHLPRPALVSVADGDVRTLVRRETEEDLLRLDVG